MPGPRSCSAPAAVVARARLRSRLARPGTKQSPSRDGMRVPDFRQWLVAGDFASAYRYAVGVAAQPAAITNKSTHQVDRNIIRPPKRTAGERRPPDPSCAALQIRMIVRPLARSCHCCKATRLRAFCCSSLRAVTLRPAERRRWDHCRNCHPFVPDPEPRTLPVRRAYTSPREASRCSPELRVNGPARAVERQLAAGCGGFV
jgi:hypothetical protein